MRTKILLACLFALFHQVSSLNAQCGTDPIAGTTTIAAASQIVNSYYPGQGNPVTGATSLTVGTIDARGSATPIAAGDLVLIIQMQGADINSTNTDSYGNGTAGAPASGYLTSNLVAGYYEYNTVASFVGSTVTFSFTLANNYFTRAFSSGAIQAYQVVRIPREFNLTITGAGSVTCPAWDGSTGGIVALDAANVLTIDGTITVEGLGFRGGGGINLLGGTAGNTNGSGPLTNTDYRWNSPATTAANATGGAKGEGIAGTPIYTLFTGDITITTGALEGYTNGAMGRGAPGNAGGGGTDGDPSSITPLSNQANTGGGGGGNAGAGGQGGSGWHGGSGDVTTFPTGGYGGSAFAQRDLKRLIMGGGGGAGTGNNSAPADEYFMSGGAGGGIILIRAASFAGTGILNADGAGALGITSGGTDAAGGGGAGGTIVAVTRTNVPNGLGGVTATAIGGRGGNMETFWDHGPGGGGGGGYIITNGAFASTDVTAGLNGLTRTGGPGGPLTNDFGATAGTDGEVLTLGAAPTLFNANNPGSACGTLPVRLLSFRATLNGINTLLNWTIDNAINFSHFEIEYSRNGISFSSLGQVSYNSSQRAYQFNHSPVTDPVNYYRLKMVDTDGSFKYSAVLVVRSSVFIKDLSVYPQPAKDHVTVSVFAQRTQNIRLELYSSNGSKVKEISMTLNNGTNIFTIDNLQALPAGIYLLKSSIDEKKVTAKIVVD
jgi:hypothetical protein